MVSNWKSTPTPDKSAERIIALWLPNWPIQRLVATRPELCGRRIVLHQPARRGQCVAACSTEAERLGIVEGMPLAEATALAGKSRPASTRSSQLHLEPHDPQADRTALQKLAQWCHQYSPTVGLEQAEQPQTIWLSATGMEKAFGSEQEHLQQIQRGLSRLRLVGRLALADTIGAAWGLAHCGEKDPWAESFRPGEWDRPIVVPGGQTRQALQPLPLSALRLPLDIVEMFLHLGIYHVGALLALPRTELEARFGPLLIKRIDQACGDRAEVIEPIPTPQEVTAERLFEYPLTQSDVIRGSLEQLVQQVAAALEARGDGALEITCRFGCYRAKDEALRIGLFQPTAEARHLQELFDLHLERLRLVGAVESIKLQVTRQAPLPWQQQQLFQQEASLTEMSQLATLVDRLASRLGRHAVMQCHLQSDPQPEQAYREEPLLSGGKRFSKQSRPSQQAPLARPLQLLRQPVRLGDVATTATAAPQGFHYQGCEYRVARHWGPERIQTGWWRRRSIERDYYQVETETGQRFWLFQQLPRGTWFLHGTFA